jgi:hypothetical protein
MARMSGIPARVITGYKADLANSINTYLPVKESDAHAWAELYIDDHWVRVETTSTASGMDIQARAAATNAAQNGLYKKVNLYLMYAKYQVETWILYYSNVRQLQLLQYAKNNPKFIFAFVISLLSLLMFTLIVVSYFRRPLSSLQHHRTLEPLLKILIIKGCVRQKEETMHQYFLRCIEQYSNKPQLASLLQDIDRLYEHIAYADKNKTQEQKQLKTLVKQFNRLKNS